MGNTGGNTAKGAAIGTSVLPGWGTAIGASAGFATSVAPKPLKRVFDPLGLFGGGGPGGPETRANNEFRDVNPNLGQNAATTLQQNEQLARLRASVLGTGPSIAAMQARAAQDQGLRQLQAQAASDRQNPALARRQAMIQGGALSARIQQQSMMGRLAEQQQAEAALANAINGARAADLDRARIVEQARSNRFNALMGVPSAQETQANVLASTLPVAANAWQAYQAGKGNAAAMNAPYGQAGSAATSGAGLQTMVESNNGTYTGPEWVPTGPYGQGYYRNK
jgi:hypothetical protein